MFKMVINKKHIEDVITGLIATQGGVNAIKIMDNLRWLGYTDNQIVYYYNINYMGGQSKWDAVDQAMNLEKNALAAVENYTKTVVGNKFNF